MEKYRFLWNVIRNSNVIKNIDAFNLHYKHDGVLYDINSESKLGRRMKILFYHIPRFTIFGIISLIVYMIINARQDMIVYNVVRSLILIVLWLLLPLVIIPKNFKEDMLLENENS